jgi:hypothetical protein
MEIKDSKNISGKGLYTTIKYKKEDIIYTLTGNISDYPTRETIHIGNNKHIYDDYGIYINHSFTPNIYIDNTNIIALFDIENGEELVFNYNDNEINMAAPFYSNDNLVSGKIIKSELIFTNNMLLDIINFLKSGHLICLHYNNSETYFYSQSIETNDKIELLKLIYINISSCPSLLEDDEWPYYIKNNGFVEYTNKKILPTNKDNIYFYTI